MKCAQLINDLVTTINKNKFRVMTQDLETNYKNFTLESNLDFEFHIIITNMQN